MDLLLVETIEKVEITRPCSPCKCTGTLNVLPCLTSLVRSSPQNQRWRCDECRSDNDTDIVQSTARQSVSLVTDGDLNVVASLQACFLQSDARENGDPNQGNLEI
jgi:hypothetical protein